MNRRSFIATALATLAMPLATEAQQAGKIPRIGWLGTGSRAAPAHPVDAFRQGLREHGYVEGRNVVIEYRFAEGRPQQLAVLASDLARLNVDVIVAESTPHVLAAKHATDSIPIVMVAAGDPVASGLVANLARPGGNITGLTFLSAELSGKRLELLREALPELSRVAALWNPSNATSARALKETEVAARSLGLRLRALEARGPDDLDAAFSLMVRERAGALVVLPDAMLHGQRRRIVDLAMKSGVPTMYHARDFAEAGALMSYGASFSDLYRRAATFVDKILKGARPAALPVEQPTKFELVINGKTAKALGLTVPQSLLLRADHVID